MGRRGVQGEKGEVEVQGGVEGWEGDFFFFFLGGEFGGLARECLA